MEGRKKGRKEREGRRGGGGREGNKIYRTKERKKGSDTKEGMREKMEWGTRARERGRRRGGRAELRERNGKDRERERR